MSYCRAYPEELDLDVYVLRLGHRPERDRRITTHVALVARAFGVKGMFLASVVDHSVKKSIDKVVERWGGKYFVLEMGADPMELIKRFKYENGCVVHLTMYGIPVDDIIGNIREKCRKLLIVVGAEKVKRIYYDVADYNVAIGNQPHSEVSALAIFLDRLWKGVELGLCFKDAKYYIIPSTRSKVVKQVE
ncbi:MAG: tRNA (cytidine(56)-2'-O)-methyltransferase [Ignisphaera sp.]